MTLSVLGLDRSSGLIGVATATHGFAVGARVPWARPGVGVAVTQAMTRPSFGRAAVQGMAEPGADPSTVIDRILADDPGAEHRQLAVMDVAGRAGLHSGQRVLGCAVARAWPDCVVVGNMLAGTGAPGSAHQAFQRQTQRPLAHRLVDALEAGNRDGGDRRGLRSAALLVVGAQSGAARGEVDLRVDDSDQPIAELRRLLRVGEAQDLLSAIYADPDLQRENLITDVEAFLAAGHDDPALAPYVGDLQFWLGAGHLRRGERVAGWRRLAQAERSNPAWRDLAAELARVEGLPAAGADPAGPPPATQHGQTGAEA